MTGECKGERGGCWWSDEGEMDASCGSCAYVVTSDEKPSARSSPGGSCRIFSVELNSVYAGMTSPAISVPCSCICPESSIAGISSRRRGAGETAGEVFAEMEDDGWGEKAWKVGGGVPLLSVIARSLADLACERINYWWL